MEKPSGPPKLRDCLVKCFEQQFSMFKQHYMHFHILFHPHIFPKNTNNVTRTTLPKAPKTSKSIGIGGGREDGVRGY